MFGGGLGGAFGATASGRRSFTVLAVAAAVGVTASGTGYRFEFKPFVQQTEFRRDYRYEVRELQPGRYFAYYARVEDGAHPTP